VTIDHNTAFQTGSILFRRRPCAAQPRSSSRTTSRRITRTGSAARDGARHRLADAYFPGASYGATSSRRQGGRSIRPTTSSRRARRRGRRQPRRRRAPDAAGTALRQGATDGQDPGQTCEPGESARRLATLA
jgi:hypothetical protein